EVDSAKANRSRPGGKSVPTNSETTADAQQDLQRATRGLQKETREVKAASKATRDLVSKPGAQIDQTAVKTSEGLKELKLEQARTLDEIRAAAQKESVKPTVQKSKPKKY
ncbi:MAG: hypothetical protein ABL931_09870, partial [Usitatibacteraceae bacterium]